MRLSDIWPWLKAEFRWRFMDKRYEVILSEHAQRQLEELPEEDQVVIREAMERIARNPYSGHSGHRHEIEEEK